MGFCNRITQEVPINWPGCSCLVLLALHSVGASLLADDNTQHWWCWVSKWFSPLYTLNMDAIIPLSVSLWMASFPAITHLDSRWLNTTQPPFPAANPHGQQPLCTYTEGWNSFLNGYLSQISGKYLLERSTKQWDTSEAPAIVPHQQSCTWEHPQSKMSQTGHPPGANS